jgi:hypothetical protein
MSTTIEQKQIVFSTEEKSLYFVATLRLAACVLAENCASL